MYKIKSKMILLFLLINNYFVHINSLDPGDHKEQARKLSFILEKSGYTVQKGAYGFFTSEMCHHMESCYANNPNSPYGVVFLPKAPEEDISTYSKWGTNLMIQVDGVNMSSTFRLEVNETVIMLGQTPPRSLYYSYIPYVMDRWYPYNWSSPSPTLIGKCPDVTNVDGDRCDIFASFGNPINMLDMNTSNTEGQSFQSSFAHFMGGDKAQLEAIRKTSIEAEIPSSIHNIYGLPISRVNLGLSPTSDGIMHMTRTAFTENENDHNEYIDNPSEYITILRVTPPLGEDPVWPFPPHEYNARVTDYESTDDGFSYEDLSLILEEDLKEQLMEKYLPEYPFVEQFRVNSPNFENGYDCMEQGLYCNGDNQDTLYPNSKTEIAKSVTLCTGTLGEYCPIARRSTLQEEGTDFYIATGLNHNATKSALYSSLAMYNYARLESIGSFSSVPKELDPNSYVGSADAYLEEDSISQYFFAIKLSRRCEENEEYCLQVSDSGDNSLPLNNSVLFIERIYLDQMQAGPSKNATIKPIIYHFSSTRF